MLKRFDQVRKADRWQAVSSKGHDDNLTLIQTRERRALQPPSCA